MLTVSHVYHADWSKNPKKRWSCTAAHQSNGTYLVGAPQPVGDLAQYVERLRASAAAGPVLAGFDFPIGFPRAYAERAGIANFRRWLAAFSDWPNLEPATSLDDVSVDRPFYPRSAPKKGEVKKETFRQRLLGAGVSAGRDPLLRSCEMSAEGRTACSLFWTLGANQVGRAAVSGWRSVLQPLLKGSGGAVLWPFDGSLSELVARNRIVVVETYPAEFYTEAYFGLRGPAGESFAKRNHAHLAHATRQLVGRARAHGHHLDEVPAYLQPVASGKDDAFDAFIGCLGLLDCLHRPWVEPTVDTRVEGWIFGRPVEEDI